MESNVNTAVAASNSPASLSGAPQRRLVLDGLRGIAAFGIILDHVSSELLRDLTPGRYLAVDFFWVLSGFVLALGYGERLSGSMSPLEFMRHRLIRLYPLYLAGLILGFVVALLPWLTGDASGAMNRTMIASIFVAGVLFMPFPPIWSATGQHMFPMNGPSWSLFFELVANLVYACIARFLSVRNLSILVAVCAVFFVIIAPQHPPGAGWQWPHAIAGLARVMFCFFVGVLVYRVRPWIKLPDIPSWAAVAGYMAMIMMPVPEEYRSAFNIVVALVGMPLLVALAADAKVGAAQGRVFATLGMLSYGVYVLHVPIWTFIAFVENKIGFHPPGFVNVLMVSVIAVVLAWVGNYLYDVPLRRWLMKATKARPVIRASSL